MREPPTPFVLTAYLPPCCLSLLLLLLLLFHEAAAAAKFRVPLRRDHSLAKDSSMFYKTESLQSRFLSWAFKPGMPSK